MAEQPYYYCEACPAAAKCSSKAWSRAKCKGGTPEECVAQVKHHLSHSSLHFCSNTEVDDLVKDLHLKFHDPETEPSGKKKDQASPEDYTSKNR